MPAIPELTAPLSDGAVSLRPFAERDIPEILIAYQDDPTLHTRLGQDRPPTGAQLGRAAEQAQADRLAARHLALSILESGSDVCRGQITVHHIDPAHARAEVGIWLAPQVRGRGIAVRSLGLIAPWLFDACAFDRIAVLTEPDNHAMLAAARAAGFVDEGVLRGYASMGGIRVDNAILSLLPSDLDR